MRKPRRYDLGFEQLEEDLSMYEDYTPIIIVNNDYGEPELVLTGREMINHYIKTGEILNDNNNTDR